MAHCEYVRNCEDCVEPPLCYWTTLFNGTELCVRELPRLALPYDNLVTGIAKCPGHVVSTTTMSPPPSPAPPSPPPEESGFLGWTKLAEGVAIGLGLAFVGIMLFKWGRSWFRRNFARRQRVQEENGIPLIRFRGGGDPHRGGGGREHGQRNAAVAVADEVAVAEPEMEEVQIEN